jgi:hypothetical protein
LMESDYVEMKDKKIRLTDFMFPEGRSWTESERERLERIY